MGNSNASDDEKLLAALDRTEDRSAGNVALRRTLGWSKERYIGTRNRCIENGEIAQGKGRGGSVQRLFKVGDEPVKDRHERDVYAGVEKYVNRWALFMNQFKDHITCVTASGGKRTVRGRKIRPDICVVGMYDFSYIPGRSVELITIEVKMGDNISVDAVYDALGHRRWAHRAYVWFVVSVEDAHEMNRDDEEFQGVVAEARRHGIGILVGDPRSAKKGKEEEEKEDDEEEDYNWQEVVEATRVPADPQKVNEFLSQQIPDSRRLELRAWCVK